MTIDDDTARVEVLGLRLALASATVDNMAANQVIGEIQSDATGCCPLCVTFALCNMLEVALDELYPGGAVGWIQQELLHGVGRHRPKWPTDVKVTVQIRHGY